MKLGSFAEALCLLYFATFAEGSRYIRTEKSGRLGSSLLSGSEIRESEALPGWLGDIYRPAEPTHEQQAIPISPIHSMRSNHGGVLTVAIIRGCPSTIGCTDLACWPSNRPFQVSEHPRAYVWPGMLSEEEANHIIHLAAPHLKRSTVVGKHEEGVVDNIRTSYGTFVPRLTDAIIERIERRIATWTNTSLEQQEDIQVLRYVSGQKYGAHHDGLGRMATVVMFLVDTEEGGETIFPTGKWLDPKMAKSFENVSPCAKGHIGLKPRKGDALLFYDKHPDGTDDSDSIHTACPVIKGVKWSAPVWIHPQPFRAEQLKKPRQMPKLDPGVCRDHHNNCESWAEAGECKNNPGYMTGEGGSDLGACRHACGICEPCELGDSRCYMQNRERAGFLNIQEEIARITAPLDDDSLFGHDEV